LVFDEKRERESLVMDESALIAPIQMGSTLVLSLKKLWTLKFKCKKKRSLVWQKKRPKKREDHFGS